MFGLLLVFASSKVKAQEVTATLEEIYLHCPQSTAVVYKEINDSFGMRLKVKDCDLSLIKMTDSEKEYLLNETPARIRRIKKRQQE